VDWIHLAQSAGQLQTVSNTVMNVWAKGHAGA
jgi:hypothetical protein